MLGESGRFFALKYLLGIHRYLALLEEEKNGACSFHVLFPGEDPSVPAEH